MEKTSNTPIEIGQKLFSWRDYTPIPLILLLLFTAEPTVLSAVAGTILIICGELIRIYSVAFIGSVSRTRSDSTGGSLVTTGPFSYVRNPLYVGNFGITMGIAVFASVFWVAALTAALFAFQYYYIVKYEESLLIKKFGDEYKAYLDTVPAWIPKRIPKLDEIEWPKTYAKALKSEKRTLSAIGAVVLLVMLRA